MEKITDNIFKKIMNVANQKDNKEKLYEYIVDPLILNISSKLYPYFILLFIMYILLIGLIISILILIIIDTKKE